jgi:hypothetical protein
MQFDQHRAVLLGAFGAAMSFGAAIAQDQASTPFARFSEFVAGLHSTTATKMTTQPFAAVKTPVAAEAMRQHLLGLYEGVSVKHSYALNGQTFDCMPINQQPSVRQLGIKTIAAPPPKAPASTPVTGSSSLGAVEASQQSPTAVDAFGNTQRCEAGSFPMRRITLQEISRFKTLQEFFQKGPAGAGQAPQKRGDAETPPSEDGHTYAHEYQSVNNYGGYSVFSLFSPYVDTSLGEVFSLSQHWYVGYTPVRQTAEIGLQVFPAKYGSENAALFIYFTPDNYAKGGRGCYNHDCAAFVQVNSNWHLGGGFSHYSTVGGAQYELALGFYLYNGNWWMAAGNDWVGYYPGSLYNGGQLSRYAQTFDLGGETVGSTIWPPMGSGQYASAGWTRAAYHRSILYRDAGNSVFNPSLTVSQPWPSCQTASPETWGGATWRDYFFFGGPGGRNC